MKTLKGFSKSYIFCEISNNWPKDISGTGI